MPYASIINVARQEVPPSCCSTTLARKLYLCLLLNADFFLSSIADPPLLPMPYCNCCLQVTTLSRQMADFYRSALKLGREDPPGNCVQQNCHAFTEGVEYCFRDRGQVFLFRIMGDSRCEPG